MFSKATPKTAQFVVINGKYIPKARYSVGENLFKNISTSWTSEAITRIKATVSRNSMFNGTRINVKTIQEIIPAKVMTNITAMPIPIAVSTFLETPKKGQIPKKRITMKLFIKIALINIKIKLLLSIYNLMIFSKIYSMY